MDATHEEHNDLLLSNYLGTNIFVCLSTVDCNDLVQ
jgi:hypothetical protein